MNTQNEDGNGILCGASFTGKYHSGRQIPCQDAWYSVRSGGAYIIAVSDGLSSAEHSDIGSQISVKTACESIYNPEISRDSDYETVKMIFRMSREALEAYASLHSIDINSLACTLLLLLMYDDRCCIGHLGDGIIVGENSEGFLVLSAPERSEYVNETSSLTQRNWEDRVRITGYQNIISCILATDGCQSALFTRENGNCIPYTPFVEPLISYLRRHRHDGTDFNESLLELLGSERFCSLSPDDKTLVIIDRAIADTQ